MKLAATRPRKALCDNCTNVLTQENLQRRHRIYMKTGSDSINLLQKRAEAGCLICSMVVTELLKITPDSVILSDGDHIRSHIFFLDIQVTTKHNSRKESNDRYVLNYAFHSYEVPAFYEFEIHLAPILREYTSFNIPEL